MKQSIFQRLFSNLSSKKIFFVFTLLLWVLVSVPVGISTYFVLEKVSNKQYKVKTDALEQSLTQAFKSAARYGDVINSKGYVKDLGRPFGLVNFEICKDSLIYPLLPMGEACPLGNYQKYSDAGSDLVLSFLWKENIFDGGEAIVLIATSTLLSLIFVFLVSLYCFKVFKLRLHNISGEIQRIQSVQQLASFHLDLEELKPVTLAIRRLFIIADEYSEKVSELKANEYKIILARQVAHDIRSPVTALQIAISKMSGGIEERDLALSATSRISKIANDLLSASNEKQNVHVGSEIGCNVLESVEEIITEKRLQFEGELVLNFDNFSKDTNSNITKVELQRILSNLLNNAIESFDGRRGVIQIYLRSNERNWSVAVQDNGKGIPVEILDKIGVMNFTFNKLGGSGLGVNHTIKTIEKYGGKFQIQSKLGEGTMATIILPKNN